MKFNGIFGVKKVICILIKCFYNEGEHDNKSPTTFLTVSPALARIPGLERLVGSRVILRRWLAGAKGIDAVLAWGRKSSAHKAEAVARSCNLPLIRLEDGFLRSIRAGQIERPLSLILDDLSIYYDASRLSRFDILANQELTESQEKRARDLLALWQNGRVSKYNHAVERSFLDVKPYVLVVDQTFGDASVIYGKANEDSFHKMLVAAIERFPGHRVVLKAHPDVVAGRKQGYSKIPLLAVTDRVELIDIDVHAPALLEHADAVFCVTSQMGFEALLWGKPVHCFGMPFYAGRGLTKDALPAPAFRAPCTTEQLIHAAFVDYCRYVDPETGEHCDPERVISWMGLQRKMMGRFGAILKVTRFPRWKRRYLKKYFLGSKLLENCADPRAPIVVWGMGEVRAEDRHRSVIRVEDGFIRSAGLGVDLTAPQSWVLDTRGLYYDSTKLSDLEYILQFSEIDMSIVERGEALIGRLRETGTTKYNIGLQNWTRPANNKRVILIPGQVETDASVKFGSPKIKTNADLLTAVREDNPDAWIVYKVHPDVAAGMRKGKRRLAQNLYDEIVTDQDMHHMLMQVDEVHTMTSLAGFEGLIRGKRVVCYGQPFYCGWGLTEDKEPLARRTRRRSLPELVGAALILYPTYVSNSSGYFTTVERVLDEIQLARAEVSVLSKAKNLVFRFLRLHWRF